FSFTWSTRICRSSPRPRLSKRHALTPSQEVPTIMPRRRRGGWALSPWPARSGLLTPREVILPTSHTSRAEGPRPTLPRARQASFPARPPGASVPRPGKSGSRAKVVAVPSGISRRMPRGDPLMGSITDRTRSRFGRRRPYFLAGSVLIFLAFALHWYAPAFASETARFAYALFSYIFFATVFTLVMVPYSALAAEITLDYHERTRLNSVRLAFSLGAGVAAALVPMPIVRAFPTPQEGYLPMGIIFGLLFAAPWPVIFLHIRERPELQTPLPTQRPPSRPSARAPGSSWSRSRFGPSGSWWACISRPTSPSTSSRPSSPTTPPTPWAVRGCSTCSWARW